MNTNPRPANDSNWIPAGSNTKAEPKEPMDSPASMNPDYSPTDFNPQTKPDKNPQTKLAIQSIIVAVGIIGGVLAVLLLIINSRIVIGPAIWRARLDHFSCGPTRLEGPADSIEAQTGNFFCTATIEIENYNRAVSFILTDQYLDHSENDEKYQYSRAAHQVMGQPVDRFAIDQKSLSWIDLIFEVPEYPYQQHITHIYLKKEPYHETSQDYDERDEWGVLYKNLDVEDNRLVYEGLQSYQRPNQVAETAVNMLRNYKEKTGHWPGHVADLNWAYGVSQDWNLEGDWGENLPNHENASKITDLKTLLGREPYQLMDLRPDGYYLRDRIFVVLEATCDLSQRYIENWQTPETAVVFYKSYDLEEVICLDA